MPNRLTKEAILEGTNRRVTLHVPDYDADVVVRPLSDGELSKVFALLGDIPVKEDGTPNIDKVEVAKNLEALRLATSLGLVEPKLTLDEVASMKFGVPELVGMKILEVSGVAPPADVKKKK